ncbi:MAG: TylF/MycF/NovP-related O-methyltransferase [Elusimicrobiota bacterium]|nr:TylF/MycF/NovP-related O-methyltransferase [Elusimicrobiota bacterium]
MTTDLLTTWTDGDWESREITNPRKPSNISIVLDMLETTREIPGDVAECGIFRGSSLAAIAAKLRSLGSRKGLWAFDSFQGLPAPKEADTQLVDGAQNRKAAQGYFGDTSIELVRRKLEAVAYEGPVHVVPGWFQDTLSKAPARLSLAFLDCDFYESYQICLRELWPRLSVGGVMIFDEYYSIKYPGARKAIDEYFADKKDKPTLAPQYLKDNSFERWYARKTA